MEKPYGIVYGLTLNGEIRYVGQTVRSLYLRLKRHQNDATSGSQLAVHRWMRKNGITEIEAVVLQECYSRQHLDMAEVAWIAMLKKRGNKMLNLTEGGGGMSGFTMPESSRLLVSQSRLGASNPMSKLNEEKVEQIIDMMMAGVTQSEISAKFGISQAALTGISMGRTWKNVPRPEGFFSRPTRRKKIADEDIVKIVERVRSGEQRRQVAQDFGVSDSLIGHIVAGHRRQDCEIDPIPTAKKRWLSESEALEVIELLKQGLTQTEIASSFGMARSSVGSIAQGKAWKNLPR
jgi:transposase